jgi:fucose permease
MGLVVCIGELIGGAAVPPAAGWLADRTESFAAPVIVVGVCAFCAGVAALFLKETAPRKVGAAPGQRAAEYRQAA